MSLGLLQRTRRNVSATAWSVLTSATAQIASIVPTALATLLLSRWVLGRFGLAAFDAFALILTLIAVLPLNGLGVGAAVTSAYAEEGPGAERPERAALTATRVLSISALFTISVSALITAGGWWPTLLGAASGPNIWYGVAIAIYAFAFVPGLAPDILLGNHRNHISIVGRAMVTPMVLAMAIVVGLVGASSGWLILLPPLALLVTNLSLAVIAGRTASLSWRSLLSRIPARRRHPGVRIWAVSGPMLIMSITSPIAVQSDRLILSHMTTLHDVAAYTLTIQIFAPAMGLATAAAQPLWPVFLGARSRGEAGPSLRKLVSLFALGSICVSAAIVGLSHPVAWLVSNGRVDIGWQLPLAAALMVCAMATTAPATVSIMDSRGLRWLALFGVIGMFANIGLSIALASEIGAAGPLWANGIVLMAGGVPFYFYARWRQRELSKPAGASTPPSGVSADLR